MVILHLEGRTKLGATLIEVLSSYVRKLDAANGSLFLSGISKGGHEDIVRTGKLDPTGPVRVFEDTPIIGESTRRTRKDAPRLAGAPGRGRSTRAPGVRRGIP